MLEGFAIYYKVKKKINLFIKLGSHLRGPKRYINSLIYTGKVQKKVPKGTYTNSLFTFILYYGLRAKKMRKKKDPKVFFIWFLFGFYLVFIWFLFGFYLVFTWFFTWFLFGFF
jgi:hypothetical protein